MKIDYITYSSYHTCSSNCLVEIKVEHKVQLAYIHDPTGETQPSQNTVHILDFGNDFSAANAIITEPNGIITVISEGQLQETNGGTTYEYIPLQASEVTGENVQHARDPIQVLMKNLS